MDNLMLKIENVKKEYKLGQIGGTTLRDELQRAWAKIRKKEDPTKRIGAKNYNQGETFMALNGVSFEVKKGERVGIIGHNGAGKSTLLKLISRITAPTEGTISMNGRVASMLEVGTGFNPELTGRENVYVNGAILGMTKKEIDAKMEKIIEFSEVRQFIDTPVKRYSSGMYVKLAFSVAAHLDSEIMIMDEVLAVGDMAFQKKCLTKMREVSEAEDRTILYVSHNMDTIRNLCNRCIVLNKGEVIFNGDVEESINYYNSFNTTEIKNEIDLRDFKRKPQAVSGLAEMTHISMENSCLNMGEQLKFAITINTTKEFSTVFLRTIISRNGSAVLGMSFSKPFVLHEGENTVNFCFDTEILTDGTYSFSILLCKYENNTQTLLDSVASAMAFKINASKAFYGIKWNHNFWGNILFNEIDVK